MLFRLFMCTKKELTFPGCCVGKEGGGRRAKPVDSENKWGSGLQFYACCGPDRQTSQVPKEARGAEAEPIFIQGQLRAVQ